MNVQLTATKERNNKIDCKMAASDKKLYRNFDESVQLRSCEEEVNEPLEGHLTGSVPAWLQGTLLRNGPGTLKVGSSSYEHVFDGLALLHSFVISKETVTYQCKFLRSNTYNRNQAEKRIVFPEFGTNASPDPGSTVFKKLKAIFNPAEYITDNALISVYPFGSEIYALTETSILTRINPKTLEVLGQRNLMKSMAVVSHSAHPHIMSNGDVYNIGMQLYGGGFRHVVMKFPSVINEKHNMFDRAQIVGSISTRWFLQPAYMHSFGITKNYFVIVEHPLAINIPCFLKSFLTGGKISPNLKWYQKFQTNIVLLSRETGKEEKRYCCDTFFFLHIINCYEKQDALIVDLCTYKDARVMDAMYISSVKVMQSNPDYAECCRSVPCRIEMPLEAADLTRVHCVPLANVECELPRINYHFNAKPYRYFYAVTSDVAAQNPISLLKVDTTTGKTTTWSEINCYASEPVFVSAPNSQDEDDGVLLSVLTWGGAGGGAGAREREVALLVVDARSMQELARAHFRAPSPVPRCLHGWFLEHDYPEQSIIK